MGHSSVTAALFLATLGGFAVLLGWGSRWPRGARTAALTALSLTAVLAHSHSLTRDSVNAPLTISSPAIHLHEFLHYYLGSKYFEELGHAPLYEAVVIADYEDDPTHFRAENRFRDLRTNQVERVRGDVIREGSLAKRRFNDDRWADFKADVGLLRSGFVSLSAWHDSAIVRDHGYNGSPLTTLLLGALANQPFVPSITFLQSMRWMDLLLFGVIALVIGQRLGRAAGATFVVLWFANPFNDYGYIGGSFLRYNFALALVLAWDALDRGHRKQAGAWLAIATHLRIFPALFAAGLLLHDLLRPGPAARRAALRKNRPLYTSLFATGVAIAILTAFTPAPDERNVWEHFEDRISVHARALAFNAVGLSAAFAYSPEQSIQGRKAALADGERTPWEDLVSQTLVARNPIRFATMILLLGATLLCARRLPERYAIFLGFPLLFTLMYSSHYYYLSLGLLALVFHDHRAALLSLTAGFGAIALLSTPTLFDDDVLRFAWSSVAAGATLIGIGAVATRPPTRPWQDAD